MRTLFRICLFCMLLSIGYTSSWARPKKEFIVVLDAGHGGKDAGCVGKILKEKDLNLKIALKVGKYIEQNCPNVKVVYTRKTDVFVTLMGRTEKANKANADLFISIHADAIPRTRKDVNNVFGAGTFTLGTARNQSNLEVAMRENQAILLEDNYETRYEGFDPSKPESYIIFDMMQSTYQAQSIEAAEFIQSSLVKRGKRHNREVRQAGFYVLRTAAMPSVLIETGFISCNKEEKYLASAAGQESISKAIYLGFVDYKKKWDQRNNAVIATNNNQEESVSPGKGKKTSSSSDANQTSSDAKTASSIPASKVSKTTPAPQQNDVIYWKIQFLSSPKRLKKGAAELKGLWPVEYYKEGGTYRYTYGKEKEKADLQQDILKIRKKFKDAFIVKFDAEGNRIK